MSSVVGAAAPAGCGLCGGVPCVRFTDSDGDTVEFGIGAEREKGARALFFLYEHV